MGFVSTFCPISGCSPIAAGDLLSDQRIEEAVIEEAVYQSDEGGAEKLREAVAELVEQEKGRKKSELTVIGVINDEGHPIFADVNGIDDYENLITDHADDLKVVTGWIAGDFFEFGSVEHTNLLSAQGRPENYVVSFGAEVMPHNHYTIPDVDQGLISEGINQFLLPLVKWNYVGEKSVERLRKLGKEAETLQEIKQTLVHEGGYWVWMAGDVFPLSPSHSPAFSDRRLPSPITASSTLDSLPFDLLSRIASFLPLPSLLSLASTTSLARRTLLGTSQVAREWLANEGRFWLPLEVDLGISSPEKGAIPRLNDLPKPKVKVLELSAGDDWWSYLYRCAESGNMKNRRRVWKVVEGIERKAKGLGV